MKKSITRVIALVLLLALLTSLMPIIAIAAVEEPTMRVGSTTVNASENKTVTVPVYLEGNTEESSFYAFSSYFTIPQTWSVTAINYYALEGSEYKVNIISEINPFPQQKPNHMFTPNINSSSLGGKAYLAMTLLENYDQETGYICWLTYGMPDNIENGLYTIEMEPDVIQKYTANGNEYVMDKFQYVPGTVTVTGGADPVASSVTVTAPEETIIAVPLKGATAKTVQLSASVMNQTGGRMPDANITWNVEGSPAGVSINDSGQVTVNNTAAAGEITVVAKCDSAEGSCQLTLTKETSVVTAIEASDKSVDVPTQGQPDSTVELTATVYDQYGVPMSGQPVAWTLVDAPAGVSLNGSKLTVTKDAQEGAVQIEATCGDYSDMATVTIHKAAAVPETVVIHKDGETVTSDSITIPQSGSNAETYTAVVYDQYGAEMENPEVTWTLTGAGAGVSQTDGTVTVTPDAAAGKCTLEAACGGKTAQVAISVAGITFHVYCEIPNNPVYGKTWEQMITSVSGTASIGEKEINGTFFVLDRDTVPDAGRQSYRIGFTGGGYENITAQTGYVNILPKPVTVTGITAQDKPYDGCTTAVLTVSEAHIDGIVGSDELTVASATGAFGDENVGTGKNVNISEIILGGADAANYTVGSLSQKETYASIKPKPVSVSGITAQDKEYDGDTTAELDYSKAAFTGKVDGDDLTVDSATGAFEDKNAGDDKPVSISEIILGGEDAGNYQLTSDSASTVAAITAKTLTHIDVSGVTVTKQYDGTTAAGTASGNVTFTGNVASDDIGITATAGLYADENAGSGKTVALSLTLTGRDASNYTLEQSAATIETAVITACDTFTDATATEQNVVVGVGAFAEPVFTGVNGEAVTGTTTYTAQGSAASYDEIVGRLKSLTKGETASIGYSFTANGNYTGVKTGFITVTMVDILFTVDGQPATSENAVTVQTNPTYGQSWNEIVSIAAISATLNGQPVTGSYSLVTEKEIPAAGPQQYVVRFTVGEKSYDVCGGTVTIAPKALTITGVGAADKIYDGTVKADATGDAVLRTLATIPCPSLPM